MFLTRLALRRDALLPFVLHDAATARLTPTHLVGRRDSPLCSSSSWLAIRPMKMDVEFNLERLVLPSYMAVCFGITFDFRSLVVHYSTRRSVEVVSIVTEE